MPTSDREMTMTPLLRRLKQQIERERGFRCFKEQVSTEQVVMAYASALGLDCCEMLRQWTGLPEAPPRKRTMPRRRGDDDQPLPDGDEDEPLDDDDEIAPVDDDGDDDEDDEELESRRYEIEFDED
jgi:hypothetical protein